MSPFWTHARLNVSVHRVHRLRCPQCDWSTPICHAARYKPFLEGALKLPLPLVKANRFVLGSLLTYTLFAALLHVQVSL
jgi:hypothetical protein